MKAIDRQDVITEITDNYIATIQKDITAFGDVELLNSIIRGDGFTQINELSNEELIVEYKELFNEDIEIESE